MRTGAQIKAAIEVLDEVLNRHRPAATALADWGRNHRFAGSGDRAAIGNLVYDALRRRRSLGAQMESDTSRALALGAAPKALGLSPEAVIATADGSTHAVEPPSEAERTGLQRALPTGLPELGSRRFPGLARAVVPTRLRRRRRRGRGGTGAAGAGRPARQHAESRP